MNVLLVVASYHHKNTEKVAVAMARVLEARIAAPREITGETLQGYDLIGFGSGIDSDRHYGVLLDLAAGLPRAAGAKVFLFSTCGMPVSLAGKGAVAAYAAKSHTALRVKLTSLGYVVVGEFSCAGHNTNSFLKLFGGLNKGRPDAGDLADAEAFARSLRETQLPRV